jgi:hypothetical protein
MFHIITAAHAEPMWETLSLLLVLLSRHRGFISGIADEMDSRDD